MRTFIAIEFPEEIKDALLLSTEAASIHFSHANLSRRENYHLTLAFLGEIPPSRVKDITAAMDGCGFVPFPFTVGKAGRFRRDGGDTVWRRVDAPDELYRLQAALTNGLAARGFRLEERDFKPHVTVAREVTLKEGTAFRDVDFGSPVTFTAKGLTLMRSDRINGKLTYTPIYGKK